jgi:hypothetical protein
MSTTAVNFHLGDEPVGYAMAPMRNDPGLEHWLHMETRFGSTVLSLTVQGGRSLSPSTAESIMSIAAKHVLNACSTEK